MPTKTATGLPPVVSQAEWEAASQKILAREKQLTREHDRLAAERRRMPMVEITKDYTFEGPGGKLSLLDLFEDRPQLILYHFMFGPGASGWPTAGCDGCSMVADQMPHLAHLHARNTSFVMVSLAPLASILKYQKRMGWTLPWYSSAGSDFNKDFGATTPKGTEIFGLSVFLRDGERVFRSYFTNGRGVETLGTIWTLLDLTPYGRQEDWEDTPAGRPKTAPYQWWRRHDEYAGDAAPVS